MEKTLLQHIPVLLTEALELLHISFGGIYVDGTLGSGGHCEKILSRLAGSGKVIGLDLDRDSLDATSYRLNQRFSNLQAFQENFKNLAEILRQLGIPNIHGCLLDLGVSSPQLDTPERGFSFRYKGPLDMRMDLRQKQTAADLVNQFPQRELISIFRKYGEEPQSRKIAEAIVRQRKQNPIRTTTELAQLVGKVKRRQTGRIHPATKIFQALRIEVNQELTELQNSLDKIIDLLLPGGRLVVITFHSLEDKTVKNVFRKASGKCICFQPPPLCACPRVKKGKILTRKPMTPDDQELDQNPRARSAKMRAIEKISTDNQQTTDDG